MCLAAILREFQTYSTYVGYKVYPFLDGKLHRDIYSKPRMGRWATSSNGEWYDGANIRCTNGQQYVPGFHILPTLQQAKLYAKGRSNVAIVEVLYKNTSVRGLHRTPNVYIECIIASQMKINKILLTRIHGSRKWKKFGAIK